MRIYTKDLTTTNGHPIFNLTFYRPGLIDRDFFKEDFAFGPLARIDHAILRPGAFVAMHEHQNDEIFSYIYRGSMLHEDSMGQMVTVTPENRMMMNAGKSFFHQESTPHDEVEMLQIFIRPSEKDLEPMVQFSNKETSQWGDWNYLVGPQEGRSPLTVRQDIHILDAFLENKACITIPKIDGYEPWLYVMDGTIISNTRTIEKGEALTLDDADDEYAVEATEKATVVLFLVNLNAKMTYSGNFSGVKR